MTADLYTTPTCGYCRQAKDYLKKLGVNVREKDISKNPGLHIQELTKQLNIPRSTLNYHIKFLEKRDYLETKKETQEIRVYISKKISKNEKIILNHFRKDVPRTILLLLLLFPDSSQTELIRIAKNHKNHSSKIYDYMNKHKTTISYHFKKLQDMDIIEVKA